MEKLILTQDIQLNKLPSAAGGSGIVIVQQDATGNHRITLADGNIGVVDIALTPGSVTQLNWTRDDVSAYWTAEILTPQLVINQPEKITTLLTYLVDSNGVKLRWTAPKGNPPSEEVAADRYHVYVSQSEIDPNFGVTDLPEYKQSLVPKLPGQPEELVVSQLIAGHKYYVSIISEKIIFGKAKLSLPSNVVSFIASANDTNGSIVSRIIPINPRAMYPNGLVFPIDTETGLVMKPENLADLTGIIDNEGVPEGTPNVGMSILMYGLGAMPQYNRLSWDTIVDLEGAWNLDYLYVWMSRNGEIDIQSSLDGIVFNTIASLGAAIEQGKWVKVPVNAIYSAGIKFINIAFKKSEHGIRGLLFYGKRTERGEIRGKKFKRTVEEKTMDERIGTNAFLLEDEDMVRQVSRNTRCYVEQDWVVGRENDNQGDAYDVNGNVIMTVDQVKYQFESQNIWNWDTRLADFKSTGQKIMMATNNAPIYLRPVGYVGAGQSKPVDPGLDPMNIAITTNPQNYKHMARLAYNIAARFGANAAVDQQFIQLSNQAVPGFPTGDSLKVGLNILESLEFRNEADAYWTQANGYHNWEEQAAILSAIYDGHKGALGAGFGAKTADPDLKISMSSLALGGNVGFVKRMCLWWDKFRGIGDYPLDIINIHHYNGSGGSQTVPVYSDVPSEGLPPEEGEFLEIVKHWVEFRDTQCQKAEIRLTEIGYDEQYGGVYSPGYRDQATRSKYKGYWLSRMFLLAFQGGLDVVNQFWFANTDVRLEDLNPNQWTRDVFITCGYTDGITAYNDWNRKPLVSFWYVANLMTEITGFSFAHTLVWFGETKSEGLVFATYNPKLMALAYTNSETSETMVVAWLSGAGFNTGYVKLYVDASEGSVDVIKLDNAEIRQNPAGGLHTATPTSADGQGKFIDLLVSEALTLVKTKNIGVKKLENPLFFNIESVSNSVIKLAWEDRNIGDTNTVIYQSNFPDRDFVEVFNGYIDNGEYILEDLLEGTNYFYKIGFVDGASVSAVSESIGITTLSTLQPPANLRVDNIGTNSITLRWDYTTEEQAQIDEFELYRSLTPNGVYTLISPINKASRTYTNNGLTASTQYYYKMRSKKDFGYSEYTLGFGATTDGESALAPVLVSAKSNYAGDRLKLVFDRSLANPAGQQAGFSIIETTGGTPAYISPASLSLDGVDPKILYIALSTLVNNAASLLSISYDKAAANLQSTNAVKVESFTAVSVTNNKNNATLLSKKIQINLTDADNLAGAGWNDIVYLNDDGALDAQQYTKALKDVNGVTTGIEFIMPSYNISNLINDGSADPGMVMASDAAFPASTNSIGVNIANIAYNLNTLAVFQNLDASKEYNLRVLFSFYEYNSGGIARVVRYKDWQSAAAFKVHDLPGQSVYLTSLKALTAQYVPHPAGDGYPVIDNISTPKVGILANQGEEGVWICALILEEVLPE